MEMLTEVNKRVKRRRNRRSEVTQQENVQETVSSEFCGPGTSLTVVNSTSANGNVNNNYDNTNNNNNNNNSDDNNNNSNNVDNNSFLMEENNTKRRCCAGSLIVKLRALSLLSFVFALLALLLAVIAMVINNLISFANRTNIFYVNHTDDVDAKSNHLLIPAVDMVIGITTACVGGHCATRESIHGVISLLPDEVSTSSFLPLESQRISYHKAREEFKLGFDIGDECGNTWTAIHRRTQLLLASIIITIIALAGCVAVEMALFSILARVNVLRGLVYHDPSSRRTVLGVKRDDAMYFLGKVHTHLRWERRLVITITILALWATMWSLITMVVMLVLVERKMKCEKSVCTSYVESVRNLISLVVPASSRLRVENERGVQCKHGPTFPLVIVVFILSCVMLLFACVLLLVYVMSHREERLRRRKIILEKLVQSITCSNNPTEFGMTPSAVTPSPTGVNKSVTLLDSVSPQEITPNNTSTNTNTITEANTIPTTLILGSEHAPVHSTDISIIKPFHQVSFLTKEQLISTTPTPTPTPSPSFTVSSLSHEQKSGTQPLEQETLMAVAQSTSHTSSSNICNTNENKMNSVEENCCSNCTAEAEHNDNILDVAQLECNAKVCRKGRHTKSNETTMCNVGGVEWSEWEADSISQSDMANTNKKTNICRESTIVERVQAEEFDDNSSKHCNKKRCGKYEKQEASKPEQVISEQLHYIIDVDVDANVNTHKSEAITPHTLEEKRKYNKGKKQLAFKKNGQKGKQCLEHSFTLDAINPINTESMSTFNECNVNASEENKESNSVNAKTNVLNFNTIQPNLLEVQELKLINEKVLTEEQVQQESQKLFSVEEHKPKSQIITCHNNNYCNNVYSNINTFFRYGRVASFCCRDVKQNDGATSPTNNNISYSTSDNPLIYRKKLENNCGEHAKPRRGTYTYSNEEDDLIK